MLSIETLLIREGKENLPRYSKKFGIGFYQCLRELNENTLNQYKSGLIELDDIKSDMYDLLISRGF